MDTEKKKVLLLEIEMMKGDLNHLGLVVDLSPYDPKAVDLALKPIEDMCSFIRKYTNVARNVSRLHEEKEAAD